MTTPDDTTEAAITVPIGKDPTQESEPPTDTVSDRYRLDFRIGAGGMGEVWSGMDTRLDRPVAIKVMHRDLSGNKHFRARFKSEAKLVAVLDTPRVATLYDYGEEDTPLGLRSYLVMEKVKGGSLLELLEVRDRLTPDETMRVIAQAADGLGSAHDTGIIHRDVKPGNILVTAQWNVKLIDFGIARAKGEAGLTESGRVVGTLAYTAPEQFDDGDPTPAADVYSLGIVAYECLAGHSPFASDNPGAVLNGHLYREPPPLPADVPAAVSDVVMRALDKKPERRWESMAAFARACRDAIAGTDTPEPWDAFGATVPVGRPDAETEPQPLLESLPGKRRIGKRRVAAVLVAVALLVAVVVLWRPLIGFVSPSGDKGAQGTTEDVTGGPVDKDDKSSTKDSSKSAGDPKSTNDAKTSGSNETSGESGSGNSGGDNGGGETKAVPDLYGVLYVYAVDDLEAAGFENHKGVGELINGPPSACKVHSQSPKAGTKVDPDTTITLYYQGNENGCRYEANLASRRTDQRWSAGAWDRHGFADTGQRDGRFGDGHRHGDEGQQHHHQRDHPTGTARRDSHEFRLLRGKFGGNARSCAPAWSWPRPPAAVHRMRPRCHHTGRCV